METKWIKIQKILFWFTWAWIKTFTIPKESHRLLAYSLDLWCFCPVNQSKTHFLSTLPKTPNKPAVYKLIEKGVAAPELKQISSIQFVIKLTQLGDLS